MKKQTLKIGTRSSPLALVQVHEILELLKKNKIRFEYELNKFKTSGDLDQQTSLTQSTNDQLFSDSIDQALLNNKIDFAIHSAKDLPKQIPAGLEIFALTQSIDDTDCFVGKNNFKKLPQGAKIGTSSILRQNAIKEIHPNIKIVDIRGTIQDRIELTNTGICDGVIVATAALKRLKLTHLIKDIMPWESTPLQGQLAVVGRLADTHLKKIFSKIDVRNTYGSVYLVGAGPGDPELITQKAIRILKSADCVFYDFLTDPSLLNYAPKAQKIYAGKRKGEHSLSQQELSIKLKEKALEGKTVVRLKGGDPLIFGRGAEEIEYVESYHIPVYVIPGVSSATAIPSSLGIPLTARGVSSSVAFLSAHSEDEGTTIHEEIAIPKVETLVFLMGLTKLNIIVKSLLQQSWALDTKAMVISKGTRKDQKIVFGNLKNIETLVKESKITAPALIIIGDVLKFHKSSAPKTVIYTGTNPKLYQSFGQLIHFPTIEIKETTLSKKDKLKLINDLIATEIVLITSRFGAKYFLKFLRQNKFDLNLLKQKQFITIGQETANALKSTGIIPTLIATQEYSQGLLNEIKTKINIKNKTILFPRSNLPNPYLKDSLRKMGGRVKEYAIYQNILPAKKRLPSEPIDTVIFTSPSQVRNFLKNYATIPAHWNILVKGPLTLETIQKNGYNAKIIS